MTSYFLDDLMTTLNNIKANLIIQNNVQAFCCDPISGNILDSIDAYLIDYDTTPVVVGQTTPPTYPKTGVVYGSAATSTYKCQVAYYINYAVAEFFEALATKQRQNVLIAGFGGPIAITVANIIGVMSFPVITSISGLITLTGALIAAYDSLSELDNRFDDRAAYIMTNKATLACLLYDATDTASARNSFVQNLVSPSPGGAYDLLEVALVNQLLTNTLLNSLFFQNPQINVSNIIDTCTSC